MSNFENALKRVMSLKFDAPLYNFELPDDVLLVKEYFRRMLLWSRELHSQSWPFFDAASLINPSIKLDESVNEMIMRLYTPSLFVIPFLKMYLKWSLVENEPNTVIHPLLPPYEPLLLLFEAGGSLYRENMFLFVVDSKGFEQGLTVARHLYDQAEPFISENIA